MLLLKIEYESGENMKQVEVHITNDCLVFSYNSALESIDQDLINTQALAKSFITFSEKYMEENTKTVTSFFKDLSFKRKLERVVIMQHSLAPLIIECLNKSEINRISFLENSSITFKICEKLATLKNLKYIDCHSIPTFMLEFLDKEGIIVESRCEVLTHSRFMNENNLTSYSKMYYKINLRITTPVDNEDIKDLEAFCNINRYLKTIHFDSCDLESIEKVVTALYNERVKNIKILIHNNIHEEKVIDALKKLNKKYTKKYKIALKLSYDEEYIKNNFIKQITFTTLKVCSFLMFVIIGGILGYIFLNNNNSLRKVKEINEEINTILSTAESEKNIIYNTVEDNDSNNSNEQINNNGGSSGNYLRSLLSLNSDTVGWLTVKGTNVDYPVVQTNDNNYYLRKNYNKQKDFNGWVFMDYRNNPEVLDKNTIIYGHNIYYSDVMFGTLTRITKKKWREVEENHYITYNTLDENLTWKIFSVYSINVTSDYLLTTFDSDDEWMKFISLLKNRSDYEFDTEITKDDKILTLSTCLENNRRLVVHAVMIKE